MGKIAIAIVGKNNLHNEGLLAMLSHLDDFEVLFTACSVGDFLETIGDTTIHVLIRNMNKVETSDIDDIGVITKRFPKLKILMVSNSENEDTIYRIIKAGVKGFLTGEASRQELVEAVYTLRNGFDYFSKCIMDIIVNNYINNVKSENTPRDSQVEMLSSRELDILRLWGDGLTNKEIADKLFISIRTVESHKTHIMNKLNLKTFVDLLKYSIKNNIIKL